MCIGDKRKLTITPEFRYGQRVMGPVSAGSTLVFATELGGLKGYLTYKRHDLSISYSYSILHHGVGQSRLTFNL